ncbi:response regulator transcription factor [Ciceribacter sp. RN22]|uniref:response regulator transcription factor n=1 Tax=Ciceribacter sp. RN22 TaxID=2954932 RepID=UPI0035B3D9DE
MLMTESALHDAARRTQRSSPPNLFVMVAKQDLLSECLAEVLSKHFPETEITVYRSAGEITRKEWETVRLLLLYDLAETDIHEIVEDACKEAPEVSIAIVLDGGNVHDEYLKHLVATGAIDGILPLSLRLDVFLAAIDLLAKGGEHFPAALLQRLHDVGPPLVGTARTGSLIESIGQVTVHDHRISVLTTREVQILNLICQGTQNKTIADLLHLSENTVKAHIRSIYKKMKVKNRTEAASRFFSDERADPAGKDYN